MARQGRKKKVKINYGRLAIFLLLIAAAVLATVLLWPPAADLPENISPPTSGDVQEPSEPGPEPEPPRPDPVHLSIMCVGDIMVHNPQLDSAYDSASGTYNFKECFKYIKPYIESADLALANVESTFNLDGKYSGYPFFDSPPELAEAIAWAGFDIGFTANNHMLDSGTGGIPKTIDTLTEAGVLPVGSRKEDGERSAVIDVKGLKVGIVAYTYETTVYSGGSPSINGSNVAASTLELINSYATDASLAYGTDEARANIAAEFQNCRDRGAQILIAYFHWGTEYGRKPSEGQIKMAQWAAEEGADIIFASHPHVVQRIEVIEIEVDYPQSASESASNLKPEQWTKRVPVFYSMGNIISNQRAETLKGYTPSAEYTEQGIIACVDLDYDTVTGEISGVDIKCIPTWVEKYRKSGKNAYYVIPLTEGYEENEDLVASGHKARADKTLADTKELLGEEYIYK